MDSLKRFSIQIDEGKAVMVEDEQGTFCYYEPVSNLQRDLQYLEEERYKYDSSMRKCYYDEISKVSRRDSKISELDSQLEDARKPIESWFEFIWRKTIG